MEKQRVQKEKEEAEKAAKAKQKAEIFDDSKAQWEQDKADLQDMAIRDKKEKTTQKTAQKVAKEVAQEVEEAPKGGKPEGKEKLQKP